MFSSFARWAKKKKKINTCIRRTFLYGSENRAPSLLLPANDVSDTFRPSDSGFRRNAARCARNAEGRKGQYRRPTSTYVDIPALAEWRPVSTGSSGKNEIRNCDWT